MRARAACALAATAAALLVGGCGGGAEPGWIVRDVPGSYPTIQAAVDAAKPGDLVRIAPGTYHEDVVVPQSKTDLVVRGIDRNRVIVDGGRGARSDGITVRADGAAVENLTVRGFASDGVLVAPHDRSGRVLQGWRVSYVTASANGLHGVAVREARGGSIDHVWASGHPDAGLEIADCRPCDAVVTDSVAERNMTGYASTNASVAQVVRSSFRRNRVGVMLSSVGSPDGTLAPQRDIAVVGNRIADNDDPDAPGEAGAFGFGVLVLGGREDAVARNLISGHPTAGVLLTSAGRWPAAEDRVQGNVLADNATDLALVPRGAQRDSAGSCFAQNQYVRSRPPNIERLPCQAALPVGARIRRAPAPPPVDWRDIAAPPPQPSMPEARTAPPLPGRPIGPVVVARIGVPGQAGQ